MAESIGTFAVVVRAGGALISPELDRSTFAPELVPRVTVSAPGWVSG